MEKEMKNMSQDEIGKLINNFKEYGGEDDR